MYLSIAGIAAVMLLSAAIVVPSSNAYATSGNGKGKSGDIGIYSLFLALFGSQNNNGNGQTNSHDDNEQNDNHSQTNSHHDNGQDNDRKGPKDSDKEHPTPECKNPVPAKYNKHCQDD